MIYKLSKKFKLNLRKVLQWGIFAYIIFLFVKTQVIDNYHVDFEAYCPFGGLQAGLSLLFNGTLACSMSGTQIFMGIGLVLGIVLFSKLFCSYICPLGTISEWLGRLGEKWKLRREIGGITDKILRSLKYILLIITLYFTTQTSELFCKEYDPFFASITLFGVDVSPLYATLTILILIVGSLFTRLFWCKYMCPLGAISNLFNFSILALIIIVPFVILQIAGVSIDPLYIFITVFVGAYIYEITQLKKTRNIQLFKIHRHEDSCIECGICTKKCPQGIDVAHLKVVRHADCNLCNECVSSCPVNNTLTLGKSKKRHNKLLPLIVTIVLFVAALLISADIRIPTVDQRWGSDEELARAKMIEVRGLKNVKCFGSSVSFVNQIKQQSGIVGARTFVKDHTVEIFYDTLATTEAAVKKSIFTPVKVTLSNSMANTDTIISYTLKIDKFFDQVDVLILETKLKQHGGFYSFYTQFGEPVLAKIYCADTIDSNDIVELIETRKTNYGSEGSEQILTSKFKVPFIEKDTTTELGLSVKKKMYPTFKRVFNNKARYANEELDYSDFIIEKYPLNEQMMPYLINHIGKADTGIVGIVSFYAVDFPVWRIYFVKELTTPENIWELVSREQFDIVYTNGVKEKLNNPYQFSLPSVE